MGILDVLSGAQHRAEGVNVNCRSGFSRNIFLFFKRFAAEAAPTIALAMLAALGHRREQCARLLAAFSCHE